MTTKSPFFVVEEFVSPLQCEDIVERLNNILPQRDVKNKVLCTQKINKLTEMRIMPSLQELMPSLEKHFEFDYLGTTSFKFNWYPTGYNDQTIICDNSVKISSGWKRTNEYDFSGLIFLNDFRAEAPFDDYYEVKGGKHEYITHQFGFNPQRGTLIIHPSAPNFTYSITPIEVGNLNVIRFNLKAVEEYNYDMNKFKGNYKTWFVDNN